MGADRMTTTTTRLSGATSSHASYITTYLSISGWKAIQLWWNPDMGGFWEPWETGCGYYATEAEAADEARAWAEAEGLEFKEHA